MAQGGGLSRFRSRGLPLVSGGGGGGGADGRPEDMRGGAAGEGRSLRGSRGLSVALALGPGRRREARGPRRVGVAGGGLEGRGLGSGGPTRVGRRAWRADDASNRGSPSPSSGPSYSFPRGFVESPCPRRAAPSGWQELDATAEPPLTSTRSLEGGRGGGEREARAPARLRRRCLALRILPRRVPREYSARLRRHRTAVAASRLARRRAPVPRPALPRHLSSGARRVVRRRQTRGARPHPTDPWGACEGPHCRPPTGDAPDSRRALPRHQT